ncbi:MAG: FtsX-like permease family protein, partial [Clostridiales bacterium]|nr:FtsX-like permease family protein [Clostridiales bacterium]
STVMISVITYTSVIERVKEIGVLRSIGARKRDIYGIFNAETAMIGTFAGLIGVVVALFAGVVVNKILYKAFKVANIVFFTPQIILVMLALSIGLTLFAGLIPSTIAARKDPVVCLRSN